MEVSSKLSSDFLPRLCKQDLLNSPTYAIDKFSAQVKIDQNEMPWDWPVEHKRAVANNLVGTPWNRYPDAHSQASRSQKCRLAYTA